MYERFLTLQGIVIYLSPYLFIRYPMVYKSHPFQGYNSKDILYARLHAMLAVFFPMHQCIKSGLPVFLILVLSVTGTFSQSGSEREQVLQRLDAYPEVYLSVPLADYTPGLAKLASVDYFDNNEVFLYVNRIAFNYILEQGIAFQLQKSPGDAGFDLRMADVDEIKKRGLTESWDFYPTYEAYVALMYQFEEDYPHLVKIHNIGQTVMGRDLLFAQIGPDIDSPRPVPQFMYTSTMHGDETAGFILSLRLIHHLITGYGEDEDITNLMDQVEIWICPNENPDGTYTNNNATVNGATRGNANGIDLNRNYPTPHPNPPSPPITPIQVETQAMMDFAAEHNFIMSANMHGGIELVNFPFDCWTSSQNVHADHDWWLLTMHEYVDTVHANSPPGYMTGMGNGVTHGGDWYVVYGSRQDYFNAFHACREFTLELSNQKLLNPALLPAHWEYNYRSLINYIRQATYGIHGFVTDAATQQPVFATIELANYEAFGSQVVTSMPFGNFNRPVIEGEYDVVITAEGYDPATLPSLMVRNYEKQKINILLGENTLPLYVYASDPSAGTVKGTGLYPGEYEVLVSAHPFTGYTFLYWENEEGDIVSDHQEFYYSMEHGTTTFVAVFDDIPTEFAVHFATGTGQGQVSASVNGEPVNSGYIAPAGSNVFFEADPSTGYNVLSWKINGVLLPDFDQQEYFIEDLQSVINLLVNFSAVDYLLTISLNDDQAGEVMVSPSGETFQYGQSITLSALPSPGYEFKSWMLPGGEVLSYHDVYSFSMPAQDLEILAMFELLSAISEVSFENRVKLFPNPAKNQLTIESEFPMESIEFINELGIRVLMHKGNNEQTLQLDAGNLPAGIYLVHILGPGYSVTKKLQMY